MCKCKCYRLLKLPPRGPRHDPGCAGRRVEPRGATRAATVRDLIAKRHGKKYHMHHVHKLQRDNGVTYYKVAKVQSNHAGVEEVQAWVRRQEARLKPYREKGCKVCVFDVAFVGMDGATGCMWIKRGAKAVLPNKGSRQTVALHGIYFEDGARCVREYAFADSATLIDFIKTASAKYGKLIMYGDRSSIHSSAETKEFLRRHRRLHPDRDVRLFLLPRGSPYLSVIEAFWNRLKDAVSKRYRYKSFDALRWAAMEYARTVRLKLDLYKFLYSDPPKARARLVAIGRCLRRALRDRALPAPRPPPHSRRSAGRRAHNLRRPPRRPCVQQNVPPMRGSWTACKALFAGAHSRSQGLGGRRLSVCVYPLELGQIGRHNAYFDGGVHALLQVEHALPDLAVELL